MEGLNTRSIEAILAVTFVAAVLGSSSVCLAAITDKNESNAYILQPEAKGELVAFVNEAKDFVMAQGKENALEVFNDPKGKFVRGELYIIAYDFNGTRLAHPYMPETIGENSLNVPDLNGVAAGWNMQDVAKRGSGFTYYVWPNPAHSNAQELKLTYVLKVDDGLWLGAGTYLNGTTPIFSNESREDLVAFVNDARDFALNTSKDAALKAFNDKNGKFVEGDRYIFAYDFKGNTLALPFEPEAIGTNRIDLKDPNGVYALHEPIDVAKRGSGFTYIIYKDPAKNMTNRLKLRYVTKVNDEWFLGSGIYA
ncbi:MAG: cache domain-containing protein [Methanotrichaceae archaeon]|nr:cache domain-containing protein [Methanotrichaceae archaeon]